MKEMRTMIGNEKGSAIVLITVLMTVLVAMAAMVTDTGAILLTRSQLQNGVDAAALAALQDLPGDAAQAAATAVSYATADCPPQAEIDTPQILDANRAVLVSARKTVHYGLARMIGLDAKTVEAQALARLEPITGVSGALPLAVMKDVWIPGQTVTLKGGAQDAIFSGWRGALALGGNGASNYEENLKNGYTSILRLDDLVDVEEGNMSGPTQSGTEYRLGGCPHTPVCTMEHYHTNCPRVGVIPVVEEVLLTNKKGEQTTSRKQVRICGFALFLLSDTQGNGSDGQITGQFIQGIIQGEADPDGPDYGVYRARLVQ
ncbi:MAG TPA: Tad domain-containing protein [Syntrophomonas sp.]|nr:Tad domain-containing protein [Syntrophomonas sp.]HRW11548.1 Tad domain-containing protein [Syntrophomonas sp.]